MYQMSYTEKTEEGNAEDFYQFTDSFEEVCKWVENIKEQEGVYLWTVSMVLGGSDPHHHELCVEDEREREMWQENAMIISQQGEYTASDSEGRGTQVMRALNMMPRSMDNAELFSTMMNLLNAYITDDEEKRWMLKTCMASIDAISDVAEKVKRTIN